MFSALLLLEDDRPRNLMLSVSVLIAGCITYLVLRKLFTSGYEHQISPGFIVSNLKSPKFSRAFLFQSVLSQGLLAMLLLAVALKHLRYAAYLLLAAAAVTLVGFGTAESQMALVSGETLPFYAVIFLVAHLPRDSLEAPYPDNIAYDAGAK
jgi:hypothetical protein